MSVRGGAARAIGKALVETVKRQSAITLVEILASFTTAFLDHGDLYSSANMRC